MTRKDYEVLLGILEEIEEMARDTREIDTSTEASRNLFSDAVSKSLFGGKLDLKDWMKQVEQDHEANGYSPPEPVIPRGGEVVSSAQEKLLQEREEQRERIIRKLQNMAGMIETLRRNGVFEQ
jgi:hypothetical protein